MRQLRSLRGKGMLTPSTSTIPFIKFWPFEHAADKNYLKSLGHPYAAALPMPAVNVKYVQQKLKVEAWNQQHPKDPKLAPGKSIKSVSHAFTKEEILDFIDNFV